MIPDVYPSNFTIASHAHPTTGFVSQSLASTINQSIPGWTTPPHLDGRVRQVHTSRRNCLSRRLNDTVNARFLRRDWYRVRDVAPESNRDGCKAVPTRRRRSVFKCGGQAGHGAKAGCFLMSRNMTQHNTTLLDTLACLTCLGR